MLEDGAKELLKMARQEKKRLLMEVIQKIGK